MENSRGKGDKTREITANIDQEGDLSMDATSSDLDQDLGDGFCDV